MLRFNMAKYFLTLTYVEQGRNLFNCFLVFEKINGSSLYPIQNFDPSLINWIDIVRSKHMLPTVELSCPATTYKSCMKCNLYPYGCGKAFVYLRTFIHSKHGIAFKVGVSNSLLRPLSQASPFAILTDFIYRRDALLVEAELAKAFKRVYMSPVGRKVWADVISQGYWNPNKESTALIEFLPRMYEELKLKSYGVYERLTNPILYIPTKHFATELPSWIELLPIKELRRVFEKEPLGVKGEVVSNRGPLLLLEYGDSFWVFQPSERRLYLLNKIDGFKCETKPHLKKVILKIKE